MGKKHRNRHYCNHNNHYYHDERHLRHTSTRYLDEKKLERYCIVGLGGGILIGASIGGILGGILGGFAGLCGGFILGNIAVAFDL